MNFFKELFSNHMLVCALIAYFIAQILKILITLIRDKRLDWHLIIASGGMPSSHSSTVSALCISAARLYGVSSPNFAIAFVLAAVVMYDAAGVRRAAGEHAKILNRLLAGIASGDQSQTEESLKELIGHTPLQVFMGALLGVVVPFLVPLSVL